MGVDWTKRLGFTNLGKMHIINMRDIMEELQRIGTKYDCDQKSLLRTPEEKWPE